jgi:hypothetical protein
MINYLEAKGEIYEIAKNYEELGDYYANKNNKNESKYFYEEAIKYYEKDSNYENDKINLQKKLKKMII